MKRCHSLYVYAVLFASLAMLWSMPAFAAQTITAWNFAGAVGAPDNSPAPTSGAGTITTLNMTNGYNGGSTASDDITATFGTVNTTFSEFLLRVRGTTHNGWATNSNGSGAPQYSQGIQLSASTVGFSNIVFSFDWYSTTSAIRDLQVQYTTDGATWINFQGPSATGTFIAASNDYFNAGLSPVNPTISVDFSGITAANNNANFGVRLVSAFDSTGTLTNEYAIASSTPGSVSAYINGSGNWRFGNMTFSSGLITSTKITASPVGSQISAQNVTFAATITPASGSAFPDGSVAFYDGKTQIGTTQTVAQIGATNVGTASITINTLANGVHGDITAQYIPTPANNFIASGSSMNLTIGGAAANPISYAITAPAITLSSLTPTIGEINFPYSGSVTVGGGVAPYNTPAFSDLPAGVVAVLNGSTITLSGTPTQFGTFAGNVSIIDSISTTQMSPYTLTINPPPSLGALTPGQATVNVAGFNGTIPIAGGLSPFSTLTLTGLPAGLSAAINGSQISITGTPAQLGTFTLSASVTDVNNKTATKVYFLTILPPLSSAFVPGNLLVTKGVYSTPSNTIVAGTTILPNGATATADATYPYVFNNEGPDANFGVTNPLVIDQMTTTGTLVNSIPVPTSIVVNSFSSKSEGAINLSTDRSSFTFVDYVAPVNALDVSNSNTPGVLEPGNTETTAPAFRAVVEMDLQGNFKRTTSNAYSGNNGRAAIKANGLYFVVGNAGNANGSPLVTNAAGAQLIVPGQDATALTPGTTQVGFFDAVLVGLPKDKPAKDNNFRGITIFNNTIYVTKGSGGNGVNTVYQIGTAGTLPSLATLTSITTAGPNNEPDIGNFLGAPISVLPGFPTTKAGVAPYYPFALYFANATTLYVSDEGDNVPADITNPAKSNGGLQKWILANGTWTLAYNLTNGLNLAVPYTVPNGPNGEVYPTGINPATGKSWAPGNAGLRNITGQTNADGTVTIYGVTSTTSGATDQGGDPNQLVSITDNPAFTTAAQAVNETFTVLKSAPFGEVLRGVAVLPNPLAFTAVAAGDVSSSDVILWTRCVDTTAPASVSVTLQVATDVNFNNIATTMTGNTDTNQDYTIKLNVTGLSAGKRYYYRFTGPYGVTSNVGTFKTAYAPTAKAPVHFAFSGDCDGQWRSFPSVIDIGSQQLDFFFFCGDTTYENAASPAFGIVPASPAVPSAEGSVPGTSDTVAIQATLAALRRKYLENITPVTANGNSSLKNFFASQANYTLLDNHELCSNIGKGAYQCGGAPTGPGAGNYNIANISPTNPTNPNDTNQSALTSGYANKQIEFQAFVQAYRNYEPFRETIISAPNDARTDQTYKLYNSQQWGKNMVFINTDDRSYADQRLGTAGTPRADNILRTRLGATELAWLEAQLLAAQNAGVTWKIIGVSDPFDNIGALDGSVLVGPNTNLTLSDGGKSWMGAYRFERNAILKYIADNKITNVVFLATDDHTNRVNELLYSPDPANIADITKYVLVPGNVFSIVAGPMGAAGPEKFTDHTFSTLLGYANDLSTAQKAAGINPIGLDPAYPGLHDIFRENDSTADDVRGPIDFFSPDTENYNVIDISADGKTLTSTTLGINSYKPNLFLDATATGPVRPILSFSVDAYVNPVTLSTSSASGAVNVAIPLTINAALLTQKIMPTLQILASTLPAGSTLSAGTLANGVYTLTAAQLANLTITVPTMGSYNLSITANSLDTNNYVTGTATSTLALTVTANQPPVASNGSIVATGTTAVTGTLVASDPNGEAVTIAIVTNGTKGTAQVTNAATGAFTYTATNNVAGSDTFTFKASNANGTSNTATITVAILFDTVANPVTISANAASGAQRVAIPLTVNAALTNSALQATISVTISGVPAGATLSAGTVSNGVYTLTSAQLAGLSVTAPTVGTFPLTYTATALNGGNQSLGTATITANLVVTANQAPVASSGAIIVTGTVPFTSTLTATDAEKDPLTYSIVTNGTKGVATITNATTGAFSYTAASNNFATDSFTFSVSDGTSVSNVATVAVAIVQQIVTPNAVIASISGGLIAPASVAFDGSASAPGITVYSWDFGDGSTGTGATPIHTYVAAGNYTVKLVVQNGAGSSAPASITVTLAGASLSGRFGDRIWRPSSMNSRCPLELRWVRLRT